MCITNNLQRHIRNLTNDGEVVARFLFDAVEGKHSDAKYHHKLEDAKLLNRYGSSDEDEPSQFWSLSSPHPKNSQRPLLVIPAHTGIQRGRAGRPKIPSPSGRGLG